MTVEFLLGKLMLIDHEIKLLRDKIGDNQMISKELQDEIKRQQDKKYAMCHQFGMEYLNNYGGNNGLVELKYQDHASKVITCEKELEARMNVIGQNGNDGLHYNNEE